jgi:hypothetical protein
MQTVAFRDGALRFRLPKKWLAEYLPDGGALFREPEGIGILLLNTVDFDAPAPTGSQHAVDLLANYGGHEGREVLHLKNGNALVTFVDQKDDLIAFVWEVAAPAAEDLIRVAAFSFTVKAEAVNEKPVVDIVSMLTREIASVEFGLQME